MLRTLFRILIFISFLCLPFTVFGQTSASLTGRVTDGETSRPLFGASVLLSTQEGVVVQGVVADIDGQFQITDIAPGAYTLEVSYIAYVGFQFQTTLAQGEVRTVDAVLMPERVDINTIVVSASRGEEKVLDSPASITIVDADDVLKDVGYSTIGTLRHVPGVDLAQTSIDRSQISLRGFNAANINSNVFLLNDYRPALGSEGVAFYSIMSSSSVDLDRIEVVRGPASALYGAGGDAGVVHFITKNPFDYPGTTLALTGGERSTLAGQYRHAGTINTEYGYKITASYKQADEWAYDPEDPIDAGFLSQENIPRNNAYSKTVLDGMFQYRSSEQDLTITINAGYSDLTGFLLTDLSPFQVDKMLGYYGQFRVQAGKVFGQVYANMREAGESFSYTAVRPIVQEGGRYGGQLQFNHTSPDNRTRFTVGADADMVQLESSGTLTGRNELDDNLTLLGGYAQTAIDVSDQFDINVALRGDWSNVYEGLQLSPRAALVYKPSSQHTFRTSFNSAFAAPTTFQFFLDFVIQEQPLNANGDQFLIMGRGSAQPYTFENYRQNPTASMLLPVGSYLGQSINIDQIPLDAIYGAAVGGGLAEFIQATNPLSGSAEMNAQLADVLLQSAALGFGQDQVTDAGVLGLPDNSAAGFKTVAGPTDTRPLEQTTTQLFEAGYKGIYGQRFLLTLDVYYANKKNFVGPLAMITPFIYLQAEPLQQDLQAALDNLFATTNDPALAGQLADLQAAGLRTEDISGMLATMVGQTMANQSVAVVQTDQAILPPDETGAIGAMTTFQNFGDIDYWGADLSMELYASSRLSVFGNVSLMSDDLFDSRELNEEDASLELALNAPTFKARLGTSYLLPSNWSFHAFGRYTKGYPVRSGRLFGEVEPALLVDLGMGYDFQRTVPGLRLDAMVQNVTDNRHRQFIGAPQIGRVALVRMTYTFQ